MPDPLFKEFAIKHFQEFCDEFGATCPLLFRDVLVLLKAQPEIVRCKECRFAHLTYDGTCKQCEKAIDDDDCMLTLYLPGDFFCGYGERKDGEQDEKKANL